MTATKPRPEPAQRITIEDVKRHAERVKDIAVTDTKEAVHHVFTEDATRTMLIAAGVVLVAASLAYMAGARGARRAFAEFD